MEQNKVKILVASHKPDIVYCDEVYTPIHVGRAISRFKDEMSYMIGDDTGDNISEKNPYYCELTAQYWAWKNLDCEYIGLCHYRRYFEQKITIENIDKLLGSKYDALCVESKYDIYNCGTRLITASCLEDFQIFMYSIKKISPHMYEFAKEFLMKNEVIPYNMFVMKKELFSEFAEWQFAVLSEMEKHVLLSNYTRGKRIYGYYAEMMLPVFLKFKKCRVRFSPCVSMLGIHKKKSLSSMIYKFYMIFTNHLINAPLLYDISAVIVGLKADGIDLGYLEEKK